MAASPIRLEDIRLAKSLGLLGPLIRQETCTHCGWPIGGVIHKDTCVRARRAKRAPAAPAQPWETKAA